jgi:antitoxin (DNA-binding transcriptional repressor) of toxin-antitoxin stability system
MRASKSIVRVTSQCSQRVAEAICCNNSVRCYRFTMAERVGKREFLLHTSKYLHWVEETGQELVVTHQNKETLRVAPVGRKSVSALRGFLGQVEVHEDINAPALPPMDEW